MPNTSPAPYSADELHRIRVRSLWVLSGGQVLGGLAYGATVTLGAVLATRVSGSESFSGWAVAAVTFGTAILALPMARFAQSSGRRMSLSAGMVIALLGVVLVISSVAVSNFPMMLAGLFLIGGGQAANFQSRFAAADLATDTSRGRDLSVVVWATTIGAALGPNLVGPGEALGEALRMPPLTGPYLFTVAAQVLAVILYLVALRPDPLKVAQRLYAARTGAAKKIAREDRPTLARFATFAIASSHAVMVALMAMTPVHLVNHGAALTVVGLTISLHVLGMFALSPVFGILADRIGRTWMILAGQVVLVGSMAVAALGAQSNTAVTVALVLLGLGWGMATVAGSALLTEATAENQRTRRQGRSDFLMSMSGAVLAIAAGPILAMIGYAGLALVLLIPVVAVITLTGYGFRGEVQPGQAAVAHG